MRSNNFSATGGLGFRLANLQTSNGLALGAETEAGVMNVTATAAALGLAAPGDVDELLQKGLGGEVAEVIREAKIRAGSRVWSPLEATRFAPLVTRPEKIVCIGFNYRQHAAETGTPIPSEPPLFAKFRNALNSHGGRIALPTWHDERFDFETELVIVMGQECRRVSESEALEYVAGYSIGNDFSARTRQKATSQFGAGKMCDGFAPLGPWLTPRSLIPNPDSLRLSTLVNGQLRQDELTSDMAFNCRQLVAYCSNVMTLQAGDVIFTGTPQGVILGEKTPIEQRRWLKAGDQVVSRVEGLGELMFTLA